MEAYWDERFRREGRVWGDAPSRTAFWAREEGTHVHRLRYILVRKPLVQPAGS